MLHVYRQLHKFDMLESPDPGPAGAAQGVFARLGQHSNDVTDNLTKMADARVAMTLGMMAIEDSCLVKSCATLRLVLVSLC